jgi:hypothetical protein
MAAAVVAGEVPRTGPLAEAQVHAAVTCLALTGLLAGSVLPAQQDVANS